MKLYNIHHITKFIKEPRMSTFQVDVDDDSIECLFKKHMFPTSHSIKQINIKVFFQELCEKKIQLQELLVSQKVQKMAKNKRRKKYYKPSGNVLYVTEQQRNTQFQLQFMNLNIMYPLKAPAVPVY